MICKDCQASPTKLCEGHRFSSSNHDDERDTELDELRAKLKAACDLLNTEIDLTRSLRARLRETERELQETREAMDWHEKYACPAPAVVMERDAARSEAECLREVYSQACDNLDAALRERDEARALAAKYDAEADKLNTESDKLVAELVDCEEARDAATQRAEAAEAQYEELGRAYDKVVGGRETARARAESAEARVKEWEGAADNLARKLTAAEAALRVAREALTPSGETKAAYIGEFTVSTFDGDFRVPWTTIKEIMAAILKRAALAPKEGT